MYNIFLQHKGINHEIECYSGDVFQFELVSLARERYCHHYHEEIELNATFKKFVHNYKATCEGRNTPRGQIIDSTVDKSKLSDTQCKSFVTQSSKMLAAITACKLVSP